MRDNRFIMKAISILKIAAFSIAFIFSAAFAGLFIDKSDFQTELRVPLNVGFADETAPLFDAVTVDKINRVLNKDAVNGSARTEKIRRISPDYAAPFAADSSFADFADTTARYAEQSGKIKQDGLPPEFKSAWREHMKAWRDYADFLQAMKISSVRNELGKADFDRFETEYSDEINRSWLEVLRAAGYIVEANSLVVD